MSSEEDKRDEFIKKRDEYLSKYLKEVVYPILPNQGFGNIASSGYGDNWSRFITAQLYSHNRHFRNSNYFYTGNLTFIHYTSLKSFFNILNEGALRLNDFSLLDDPQEFVYAANQFNLSSFSFDKKTHKSSLFGISFCAYDKKTSPDNFDMWRLYGNDGRGVAFVFSIENEQDFWDGFHLSKVYYGEQELERLREVNKKHQIFCENSEIFFQDNILDNNGKSRLPLGISILLGFHKNSIYGVENEVRLLKYLPLDYMPQSEPIHYSINKNYEQGYYIKLPLSKNGNFEKDSFPTNKPQIKIEKLILGYRYSENDLYKIRDVVYRSAAYTIETKVNVELSPLKSYFI